MQLQMLKGMKLRNTNRKDDDTSGGTSLVSFNISEALAISSAELGRTLKRISTNMKNTTKKTIDAFNQKMALCPRLTFSDGVKPMSGSLFSVGLFFFTFLLRGIGAVRYFVVVWC